MTRDLGLTANLHGWGVGIFFLTCSVFDVPSNIVLGRTSARPWITRIMISWGLPRSPRTARRVGRSADRR